MHRCSPSSALKRSDRVPGTAARCDVTFLFSWLVVAAIGAGGPFLAENDTVPIYVPFLGAAWGVLAG
jgi:hypothetical protein